MAKTPATVPRPTARTDGSLCLFGAPGDTANFGVTALLESVLSGVSERAPGVALTVFDNGWGRRPATFDGAFAYTRRGARLSRRYHRPESLANIRLSCRLGGAANPNARALLRSTAVLDISGGDSFSDIYGPKRFEAMCLPKEIALEARRPLLLLPQTYGPFQSTGARDIAARIVRGATAAWARDADSFERLRELAGVHFDPERHREGVDVAFLLAPERPSGSALAYARAERHDDLVVGLNISGLIYNDDAGSSRFGLRDDYRSIVIGVLAMLVAEGARVVLLPHVVPEHGPESDIVAMRHARAQLEPEQQARVDIVRVDGPRQAKWLISQLDWFCGTRMHATIAGLSSGTPTTGLAYSPKMGGVFATCGQRDGVVDLRSASTGETVARLRDLLQTRVDRRDHLRGGASSVVERAREQMDEIVDTALGVRTSRPEKK